MQSQQLSLAHGASEPALLNKTIAQCIDEQARKYGDKLAIRTQETEVSFRGLASRSKLVAKALLDMGIRKNDVVGIMADSRQEHIDIFSGAARIGVPIASMHASFTLDELRGALESSTCKVLFIATKIGDRDTSALIEMAGRMCNEDSDLEHVITMGEAQLWSDTTNYQVWQTFLLRSESVFIDDTVLGKFMDLVSPTEVSSLQFTSGTTGSPKLAMLTHINILNNALLTGNAMGICSQDVLCCPCPLSHCSGLVIGFLAALVHGAKLVLPSRIFDANQTIDALVLEKCTIIMGVPTMYLAELEVVKRKNLDRTYLRTGLIAGANVAPTLMKRISSELGVEATLIAYGMTETGPITFITSEDQPLEKRTASIGKVMPHTVAKIVDKHGNILPRGERGEMCTSGYSVQKGYFNNEQKTEEAIKTDKYGTTWMHTGDECFMDEEGYCYVTGRLKDIIIRGGQNIYPAEIEERLLQLSGVAEAVVVGVPDKYYGETVGVFLQASSSALNTPTNVEVRDWVRQTLGRHKVPKHTFWVGATKGLASIPKTGSGKPAKHILRKIAQELVQDVGSGQARL